MEVYILDKMLRPIDVVDEFISMIWTERWAQWGDFELVTLATTANSRRFVHGTWITITESKRVMIVENIEETFDPDKGRVLKIKGRDMVSILDRRGAWVRSPIDERIPPIWYMSGWGPTGIMYRMFWRMCVLAENNPKDAIPFLQWGSGGWEEWETLYPPDTIEIDETPFAFGQKIDSLYNALKGVAESYDLGFRLYKHPEQPKLYFNAYTGNDRTTAQTELEPVIFSTDMDSLQNTTEFSDSTNECNVVKIVYTYEDSAGNPTSIDTIVYDPDFYLEDGGGFDRKVKMLVITSIPDEVTDTLDYMEKLGRDELAKSRPIGALDGEVNQYSNYTYDVDYFLGDLVETRSSTGATAFMRVEEQIIVQDGNGQRSYPGLVSRKFINPGTWASWKYDVEWLNIGSEEYWSTQ
jgi:hypothetical protein